VLYVLLIMAHDRRRILHVNTSRTHRALDGDSPDGRAVEPPEMGDVVALTQVGGLHHRYTRQLAA